MFKSTLIAAAGIILAAGTASAATLSFTGGTPTPGFDVNFGTGNYDSDCTGGTSKCYDPSGLASTLAFNLTGYDAVNTGPGLVLSGPANVTVTFLGKEAGATNTAFDFDMSGNSITNQGLTDGSVFFTTLDAGGILDFAFSSNANGGTRAANDGTFIGSAAMAFSAIFNDANGDYVYAYFDDSGSSNDRDFDDMVVKIQVSAVPLPAGAVLLLSGLAGLGLARRRKTAA